MKVNFNNLRKQQAFAYNNLVETLNNHLSEEGDVSMIEAHELENDIRNLRDTICTLCCIYEDENENCKSVIDEVGEIAVFNPDGLGEF